MGRSFSFLYIPCLLFLLLSSCATGQVFTKLSSYDASLSGPYTLILYTGVYQAQVGSVIILYPQQGGYRFQPHMPYYYGWKTIKNVPGDKAMGEAGRLLAVNDIRTLRVQAIMYKDKAIGYQASPPATPPGYNVSNYYEISYFLTKENTVNIQILPSPAYHGY